MRYRMPSLKTLSGMTAAKKKMKRELGIYKVTRITNAPPNLKRKAKRGLGYEAESMKFLRFLRRLFK